MSYLKIKSYRQLKIYDVSMPLWHLSHVKTESIKLLQYIYNKDLISYIKMLFKVKTFLRQ